MGFLSNVFLASQAEDSMWTNVASKIRKALPPRLYSASPLMEQISNAVFVTCHVAHREIFPGERLHVTS